MKFITEIVTHVEGDDPYEQHKETLFALYRLVRSYEKIVASYCKIYCNCSLWLGVKFYSKIPIARVSSNWLIIDINVHVIIIIAYFCFSDVHNTSAWSDNARVIFDMGNLLFEAQVDQIDEFHTVMNDLEMTFHKQVKCYTVIILNCRTGSIFVPYRWPSI